jgi:hypothetical protein
MEAAYKYNEIPVERYYQERDKKKTDQWWTLEDKDVYEGVFAAINAIEKQQSQRMEQNLRFERLYANKEIVSLKAGNHYRIGDPKTFLDARMTYNVTKSCVDAACAKISKEKPRPLFLTENGKWALQQRAKRLSQFVQGTFSMMGTGTGENKSLYGIGRQCFKDAGKFGTGATHFFSPKNIGQVKAERAFIDEILIDEIEATYGNPRTIHRKRQVYRDVLLKLYPKYARYIEEVDVTEAQVKIDNFGADMIDVVESWHLPSVEGASDGRHAICIKNCTLDVEVYEEDYFPFLFQRWCMPTLGFYGSGIIEEVIGIQLEINKILRTMRIAQHLCAVPQVWLEYQSKTVSSKVDNTIGGLKYYTGKPPLFLIPNAMNKEMYDHLERLYQKAYELTGISQISASGKTPAGLDAAVAIREVKETENERFALQQEMYEDYFMDATRLIIKMCRKLTKEGKEPVVQFKDGNSMKNIKFSEVDIDEKNISVRAYPTNFLPSTPAGKLQDVTELVKSGFYTQEEALELLDYPDLKKINNLKTSSRDDVLKVIEKIIESEQYQPPEPYMNLELAKNLSQSYYLRCRCDGAPEKVLELLRQFQEDVKDQIKLKMLANNPALPPQQNVVTGVPTPAPQAELLPNAPLAQAS